MAQYFWSNCNIFPLHIIVLQLKPKLKRKMMFKLIFEDFYEKVCGQSFYLITKENHSPT